MLAASVFGLPGGRDRKPEPAPHVLKIFTPTQIPLPPLLRAVDAIRNCSIERFAIEALSRWATEPLGDGAIE